MSRDRTGIVKEHSADTRRSKASRSLVLVPRPPRIQIAGGVYHVTSRGNRLQAIFHDDDDRRWFLMFRSHVIQRWGWHVHAYCLMTNHFHLLVETPQPNLSSGMQRLKSGYAAYFNERHSLVGHLFQQRFGSRLIESEEQLSETLRYIALNPVRAGLCDHPAKWPWSSFNGSFDFLYDR
jgi:putative transposase